MNFNKNLLLSTIFIFSLAFNLAFVGVSTYRLLLRPGIQDEEYERPGPHERGMRRNDISREGRLERLDLTEGQRNKLRSRRRALEQELDEKRKRVRETRERFVSLLEDPAADAEEISKAADEFHQAQQTIRRKIFSDLLQMREMLDEEQRRKFGDTLMYRYTRQRSEDEGYEMQDPGRGKQD